jgi:hypothetical protein
VDTTRGVFLELHSILSQLERFVYQCFKFLVSWPTHEFTYVVLLLLPGRFGPVATSLSDSKSPKANLHVCNFPTPERPNTRRSKSSAQSFIFLSISSLQRGPNLLIAHIVAQPLTSATVPSIVHIHPFPMA